MAPRSYLKAKPGLRLPLSQSYPIAFADFSALLHRPCMSSRLPGRLVRNDARRKGFGLPSATFPLVSGRLCESGEV